MCCVQTAYANGASTAYLRDVLKLPVVCTPTGEGQVLSWCGDGCVVLSWWHGGVFDVVVGVAPSGVAWCGMAAALCGSRDEAPRA